MNAHSVLIQFWPNSQILMQGVLNMSFTSKATPWRLSKKGNLWRRCEDKVLVVGQHKSSDGYWAMCDGAYLPDRFSTEASATQASEQAAVWGIAAIDNSSIEGGWE